jgi:hypothetical protein
MPPVDPISAIPEPEVPGLTPDEDTGFPRPAQPQASTLVCLPYLAPEALPGALSTLAAAFPHESVLVAAPAQNSVPAIALNLELIAYPNDLPQPRSDAAWVLAAADYAAASAALAGRPVRSILLLGENAPNLPPALLRDLADCIHTSIDLALPRYNPGPAQGLVNSAILYPLSRALFAANIHFPLPADAALSPRMLQRLSAAAQRQLTLRQGSALLWPVAEAAIDGFSVRELDAGATLPAQPRESDFNTLFSSVVGSLFSDLEARASFWQRARTPIAAVLSAEPAQITHAVGSDQTSPEVAAEIAPMIESFHLGHANLQEIWSMVLPPQSRLALKRLAESRPETFDLAPPLWARIVYDFALAFHLRTLNRGHLLGAMTPLYLAWAASHLRSVSGDAAHAAIRIEQAALAFESERPYLVSRWRWPDRFNP